MNTKVLLADLKKQDTQFLNNLENLAQYNYTNSADKDIATSWMQAVLDTLDKAGYIVKPSIRYEPGVMIDNVVSLRKKV